MESKTTTRANDASEVLPRASMLDSGTQPRHLAPPDDGPQPLASVTHDPNSTDFTFIQEIVASVEASQARLPDAPNPGSPLASESQTGREQMTMFEFLAISVATNFLLACPHVPLPPDSSGLPKLITIASSLLLINMVVMRQLIDSVRYGRWYETPVFLSAMVSVMNLTPVMLNLNNIGTEIDAGTMHLLGILIAILSFTFFILDTALANLAFRLQR